MSLISCQLFLIEPIDDETELVKGMRIFPAFLWCQLGRELGVEEGELENTKSNKLQVGGVEACKDDMLIKWFNSSKHKPTWAKIYDVLLKMDKRREAEKIANKYVLGG